MRLGRLFFAGAIFLGLAYFALRSPLPAVDPRFIKEDFAGSGAALSISVYLDAGDARDRAHAELARVAARLRQAELEAPAEPAAASLRRAEALDQAAAGLKAAGIGNAMLRFGGNLVVRGRRGNAPWRIGLRNPRGRSPDDALAYLLADRDEAVASHGESRVVTVIGPDGPAATAAAQALFAAKPGEWRELARRRGLEQVMVVEQSGDIAVTGALGERLKFLHGATPKVLP